MGYQQIISYQTMTFSLMQLLLILLTFSLSFGNINGMRRNLVGEWKKGELTDEHAQESTIFAFKELLKTKALNEEKDKFLADIDESNYYAKLVDIERQVVTGINYAEGMNYRLKFEVTNNETKECMGGVGVILYRPINGEESITSWLERFPCHSF